MKLVYLIIASLYSSALAFAPVAFNTQGRAVSSILHAEAIDKITKEAKERMSKSIESVKSNMMSVRTGRASPNILDRVKCDYYGVSTPINQMATVLVPSSQQITVEPFEKSMLSTIEKAIIQADLGLTPNNTGSIIRINIPELTQDRRKDLLKQVKAMGEEGKVAIRNIRRDGVDNIKKMEKNKTVGEDEAKDGIDVMQKMTDKHVKEIEDLIAKKEKEVMTV
jgi:ribosome recycling factor